MLNYEKLSDEIYARIKNDRENAFAGKLTFNEVNVVRRDSNKDKANIIRTAFIRDIDKIIHCPFYNRYADKTQVYSLWKNDDITRRFLHVQFVSRIARTIGGALNLNQELIESIALGHDIGHPAFAHSGEKYLDELYRAHTGRRFLHNIHSVRVLDKIYSCNLTLQTLDGIAAFRGSKYVQSRIGDTYREALEFLKQGRKVLFSGTPCQIAGLRKFLRKDYDHLLTVDFICHGVPSPGVWQRYLSELREELRAERGVGKNTVPLSMDELPVITGISFRDKTNGWKKFGFLLRYVASEAAPNTVSSSAIKEEKEFLQPFSENPFMRGFLADVYLRPSCYACPAKSGKSGSDITIADFWGIDKIDPKYDDDKGCGLIFINTEKGGDIYRRMDVCSKEKMFKDCIKYNSAYYQSSNPHPNRQRFFEGFDKVECVSAYIDAMLRLSFGKVIVKKIKTYYSALLRRIKY